MHRDCTDLSQIGERCQWTWSPIPNQEAMSNWQPLSKEKFIFFNGVSLNIQTNIYLMTDPMPSCRLPTQNTFSGMVSWEGFFFCLIMTYLDFYLIFLYHGSFAYMLWFQILCFYEFFCVWVVYNFSACFLKQGREERRCWVGWVERTEEMREKKSWPEYVVWRKIIYFQLKNKNKAVKNKIK